MSTEFLVTSLIVVLIPGTGVIYTVSTGLFLGWRASIMAALGCTAGILPHVTASVLGLSAILHMSAIVFQCIKYTGTLYLLYLAWSMWREKEGLPFRELDTKSSLWNIALRGLLINILNPKLSIFFLAFLPLFVSSDNNAPVLQMSFLSAVFMALTFFVFMLYGLLANRVRIHVVNSSQVIKWIQRSFAATFALLGVKLAFSER